MIKPGQLSSRQPYITPEKRLVVAIFAQAFDDLVVADAGKISSPDKQREYDRAARDAFRFLTGGSRYVRYLADVIDLDLDRACDIVTRRWGTRYLRGFND